MMAAWQLLCEWHGSFSGDCMAGCQRTYRVALAQSLLHGVEQTMHASEL